MSAEEMLPNGRQPHCDEDLGGSHYHCSKCDGVTGMYGHWTSLHRLDGRMVTVDFHACCPGACELRAES